MDIQYKIDHPDGHMEVFMDATERETEFLLRFGLQYMISNDSFPFKILTNETSKDWHEMPESIQ